VSGRAVAGSNASFVARIERSEIRATPIDFKKSFASANLKEIQSTGM
jgi:hypothetical protein